ncbi:MAG: stage III sporulation protein AE, partial [Bacilli bacterium]
LCVIPSLTVEASPANAIIKSGIDMIDTTGVDDFWSKLTQEYGGFFPDSKAKSVFDVVSLNADSLKPDKILLGFLKYLFHEIIYNGKLLATIIILTVFAIILETMQNAFEQSAVSKVAYAISYMVLIIIAINSFYVAITYAKQAIQNMVEFMVALIPLVLTLMASSGNLTSVALFHPLVIFMVNIIGMLVYTVIFPLIFFSAVLHIVSSFSERYQVTQLADLLKNVSIGFLGVLLTVFLTVLSVQGATGAIADGVTINTAKYITSNFVPVVGRVIADSAETVVSASMLIKNVIGMAGVVILLFICAFPALKIIALSFIYNFSSAIMQPLGNSPIIDCLGTIGKSLIFV